MKRLLKRYGSEHCLLDATYKTIRYALRIVFLSSENKRYYQVVRAFACEGESTENILAAHIILKC